MIAAVHGLLHGEDEFGPGAPTVPWTALVSLLVAGGLIYGWVMGFYALSPLQALYSAVKVPMLLCVTTLLCLPSFYVVNSVLGLRDDFASAFRGVLAAQATLAVCLASLATVTAFFYVSCRDYNLALLFNGLQFAIATGAGQLVLNRHYRVLVRRNPRHRWGRLAWIILYVFVAIQMAWVLRPFVGAPTLEPSFLREDAWSNAYVRILLLISSAFD